MSDYRNNPIAAVNVHGKHLLGRYMMFMDFTNNNSLTAIPDKLGHFHVCRLEYDTDEGVNDSIVNIIVAFVDVEHLDWDEMGAFQRYAYEKILRYTNFILVIKKLNGQDKPSLNPSVKIRRQK